jgi:prefoldin subunit 5
VLDALNAAITAAEAVSASADATQAQVDAAASDLTAATTTFNNAKQTGTKTETGTAATDKTALTAAITAATAAKTDVVVDTAAANVTAGTTWVTQAALDALNTAITAAEAVSASADATQAQANDATSALTAATSTFNSAKQAGTKPGPAEDKAALTAAIAAATAVKSGVVVNTVAANVLVGTMWVTQAALDTLNTAIAAAEAVSTNIKATQAQVNAAASDLTAATTTFNSAKQNGTFVAVTDISFTGLPVNGTAGYPVSLAGAAVEPANATNRTIVWTVKTANGGTISGNSFTPSNSVAAGTPVQLTATIANGKAPGTDYSKVHTITVNAPGTTTPEIGFGDDTSIRLLGNGIDYLYLSDPPVSVSLNEAYYVSLMGTYTDIAWYLNGTEQTVRDNKIYLDTSTAKTIKLAVIAKKGGKLEGSGTYTFVIGQL